MSEYGTYDELVEQLRALQREYADMLARNGQFVADLTFAAFRHTDALTYEQIVESLRELRRERVATALLGETHTGMRVSASGLLGRIARGGKVGNGERYMCGELLRHLEILGREYYSGNVTMVDALLQLYALDGQRPSVARDGSPPGKADGGA